ncbi:MAG: N-acetylmuramoyl-L-alanine amidase [Phycisphaerales bacterium]|nr:N-acetylmuramoyl-L-alanine amidase [Phycisphaerales bacterium]
MADDRRQGLAPTVTPGTLPVSVPASRRIFLMASLGVALTGCASDRGNRALPGPTWDLATADPAIGDGASPSTPADHHHHHRLEPLVDERRPARSPEPATTIRRPAARGLPTAIPRTRWASGQPVPSLMNRMKPIRYITIHHDGMNPFLATDPHAAAHRLDAIRRSHRGRRWGDIGYHFAVDRGGRVWEARPLNYQGAHVKNYNEGNIGIVALGNFEDQLPSRPQLEALHRHVYALMQTFRVPVSQLRTHQQWAATACPGRNLQRFMDTSRSNGMFG